MQSRKALMKKKSNSFNFDLFRKTYKGPTIRVKLTSLMEDPAAYLPTTPFTSSAEVAEYFSPLEEEPREVLLALHLNTKHRALSIEEVSKGTLSGCPFYNKEILQGAILANAGALILIHNHPSGDPKPSPEDIKVTKILKPLAELHNIRLLDHVIIGRRSHFSLADQGLL